jgi:nucleoside-diphosphate-sugar epimerase
MSKVLITGASGFIGTHLCQHLEAKNIEFDTLKLRYPLISRPCFDNIDSIIYLAGLAHQKYTDLEYKNVNTKLMLSFASLASKKIKRFIYLSSVNVKDNLADCAGEAAKSKWHAEQGLKKIAKRTGLELVIIRAPLVYDMNAPGNFRLLLKLIQKVKFLPFGMVNNKRCFVAMKNLVDLLFVCSEHNNAAGCVFYASDSTKVSTKQFTNAIAKGLNRKIFQLPIPVFFMKVVSKLAGKEGLAEQLFDNLELETSSLERTLSWNPPYTMEDAMSSFSNQEK